MEDSLAPESLHLAGGVEGVQDKELSPGGTLLHLLLREEHREKSFIRREVAKKSTDPGGIPSQQKVDKDRDLGPLPRGGVETSPECRSCPGIY